MRAFRGLKGDEAGFAAAEESLRESAHALPRDHDGKGRRVQERREVG